MKPMSGKRLLTISASLIGARVIGAGLTFLTQILIARWLGADTLGHYAVAMSLGGVLAVVASGGFPSIAQRFIARYRVDERPDLIAGFTRSGRRATLIGSLALIAFVWTGLFLSWSHWGYDYGLALAIGALTAPAMALINLNGSIANAFRRPFMGFLPDTILRPVLFISAIAAGGWLYSGAATAVELMAMNLAVIILAAVIQMIWMHRAKLTPTRDVAASRNDREWRQSAISLVLIVLFTNYFIDVDILLLSTLLTPEQIAVFNICVRFTAFIVFALHSVNQIALPDLADAHARTDTRGVGQALARANLTGVGLALAATIGLVVFGKPILAMIGPEFTEGYVLLLLLSAAQVLRAAFGSASVQLLTVTGHQTKALAPFITGFLTLVALNFLLVPLYGLEGAGIAMMLSVVLLSVWLAILARRLTGYDVTIWASRPSLLFRRRSLAVQD
ncbi:O-antigen/teichoic acid export membrane protein [Rhodoligotrophos appendicifer]|uniref:lipopolysaccharide biosynthesis protein n=1 Tax=Rhodoligotrophos appendicifer TaxID=987056 RepID=UPI0011858E31|nr:polysaccharide biosynthesis C-terminal domain-containing protein [Rhodoligotrophos appendicifer]